MKFADFPTIHQLLIEEKLEPLETLDRDKLVCTDRLGQKYLIKDSRGLEETFFTRVFPAVKAQKQSFELLELPQLHKSVSPYLILNYYDGQNFNSVWNESLPDGLGGRGLSLDMIGSFIRLLGDFSKINTDSLSRFKLPTFDYQIWLETIFPKIAEKLLNARVLSKSHVEKTTEILNQPNLFKKSKLAFTNGDFYPRNFIQLPNGKIVVVDWEIRTDQPYRNAPINYLENHLAFLYVHMWGNNKFQRELLKVARNTFNLSDDNLQAAIILKSLEQAKLWLPYLESGSHLSLSQAQILINALVKENLYE